MMSSSFRLYHCAMAPMALSLALFAGCVSSPGEGSHGAGPHHAAINKDTPGWIVFPGRTDLAHDGAFANDPTFHPAVPIKETRPRVSILCPPGRYRAWIMFIVEADGSVGEARVVESSGEEAVDSACVECVQRWSFQPCSVQGKPLATTVELPFDVAVGSKFREGAITDI